MDLNRACLFHRQRGVRWGIGAGRELNLVAFEEWSDEDESNQYDKDDVNQRREVDDWFLGVYGPSSGKPLSHTLHLNCSVVHIEGGQDIGGKPFHFMVKVSDIVFQIIIPDEGGDSVQQAQHRCRKG